MSSGLLQTDQAVFVSLKIAAENESAKWRSMECITILQIKIFNLLNFSGQSILTSMQNLESVPQKMAELLH